MFKNVAQIEFRIGVHPLSRTPAVVVHPLPNAEVVAQLSTLVRDAGRVLRLHSVAKTI